MDFKQEVGVKQKPQCNPSFFYFHSLHSLELLLVLMAHLRARYTVSIWVHGDCQPVIATCMRLNFCFQARVGAVDAPRRSFHSSFCSNYEGLIHYKYQNGSRWVVSDVITIAQAVSPRSCEPIYPLLASSRAHLCSAFAAAYPDDVVDERFAVHWYNRPSCVLESLLVIPLKVDMVHPGRREQFERCRIKHSPHSRKHAQCPFP